MVVIFKGLFQWG